MHSAKREKEVFYLFSAEWSFFGGPSTGSKVAGWSVGKVGLACIALRRPQARRRARCVGSVGR